MQLKELETGLDMTWIMKEYCGSRMFKKYEWKIKEKHTDFVPNKKLGIGLKNNHPDYNTIDNNHNLVNEDY